MRLTARLAAAAAVLAGSVVAGLAVAPAAASAATAALPAVCAKTAKASPQRSKIAVGVQFHGTWAALTDANRECILNSLAANGATWVRIDIGWSMIQPKGAGKYDMVWGVPHVDKVLKMAHDRGLKVLATFWQTPKWASGSASRRVLPKDVNTYANAIKWASNRWKTQVQAWEIWNEPNLADFLQPPNASNYTRLLKAAYPAVKAGNPNAQVVFGGTMYVDTDWIGQAYAAGAKGSFDVMAVHPYQGSASLPPESPDPGRRERLTHTRALVDLMKAKGDAAKPIWYTEFGWSSHANTASTPVWLQGVSEAQQADYLKRTFAHVQANYPQVKQVFYYNSTNLKTGRIHTDNRGLLRRDFSPKPVVGAMKCYTLGVC